MVVAHRVADDGRHLVWTEHAVVVAVQLAEALCYLLVPVSQHPHQPAIGRVSYITIYIYVISVSGERR